MEKNRHLFWPKLGVSDLALTAPSIFWLQRLVDLSETGLRWKGREEGAGTVDDAPRWWKTPIGSGGESGDLPRWGQEEWVPNARERRNNLLGAGGGEGVGGAVQERAEMVRGVSPWGRLGS